MALFNLTSILSILDNSNHGVSPIIGMDKKNVKVGLSAKVPGEIKEVLKQIAKEEQRSPSFIVTRILSQSPEIKKRIKTAAQAA